MSFPPLFKTVKPKSYAVEVLKPEIVPDLPLEATAQVKVGATP